MTVELLQNQEAGFVDMTLGIDKASREGNYWALELSAVHQGRNVGIRLLVQDGMAPGLVDGNLQQDAVYRKGVYLLPRGHLSDALADIWVQEYGFSGAKAFNPDLGPFTGIVLEGDGRNIEREHIRVKIFYDKVPDEEMDERYFELFLYIDLSNGVVCLNEKDGDYRGPLVRAVCS